MQTINLEKIIELSGADKNKLAAVLFPKQLHPVRSLYRAINVKQDLTASQISALSEFIDVPIGMLFSDAAWSMGVPAGQSRRIVQFRTYNYFAELDLESMTTSVSKDGLTFIKTIKHPKGVELTEYLSQITDLIIKYNSL